MAVNLKGMLLVFAAIIILVLPGILFNNMTASGYDVSNPGLTCPGYPDLTCQGTTSSACASAPTQCQLSGTSISFINVASPFTQLFQGNIYGFFTGLSNPQQGIEGGKGPFDALGGTFITANCEVTHNVDGHQTNAAIGSCTQTNTDQSNVTLANALTWVNWNPDQNGSAAASLSFYQTGHTAPATQLTCSWVAQINYTAVADGPGWTYFGCDASKGTPVIGHQIWSYLVAMPVDSGGIASGTHHWYLFVQVENQDFDPGQGAYTSTSPFYSNKAENWIQTFKGILISGGSFTSQYFVPGFNGPVLGFLFGFVLLIIGIGMNFQITGNFFGTGGGFGAGINQQGTRLAQTMGIGLLVWTPLYSEFATWFTSGVFPYGLDGGTGIISLIESGIFFFGIAWTALSWN